MTCISFDQIHEGRTASDSLEREGGKITLVQVWRAQTDTNTDDASIVAQHASCPALNTAHPNFPDAYLKQRDFRNESFSKKVWIVTLTYTSAEFSNEGGQTNPLDMGARISWRSEQYQRIAFKDKDGKAITNSAGDFYDPPAERDDSRWFATVTKNMPLVPAWLLTYQDAINSTAFTIDGLPVAARQAKVQSIELGEWQYANNVKYRPLTLGIAIAKDGFALELLDQGFNKLVAGSGGNTKTKITVPDDSGAQVAPTCPIPLDGSGGVLANPQPGTNEVFRTHYVYSELDFNQLPLV